MSEGIKEYVFFVCTFVSKMVPPAICFSAFDPKNVFINRVLDFNTRNVNVCPQRPAQGQQPRRAGAGGSVPCNGILSNDLYARDSNSDHRFASLCHVYSGKPLVNFTKVLATFSF